MAGQDFEWSHRLGEVARLLLGEPNRQHSTKTNWRYGHNGSLSIRVDEGTWYSHELEIGGGILDFLREFHQLNQEAAIVWLRENIGGGDEGPQRTGSFQIDTVYRYVDEQGRLLFEVVRMIPKTF